MDAFDVAGIKLKKRKFHALQLKIFIGATAIEQIDYLVDWINSKESNKVLVSKRVNEAVRVNVFNTTYLRRSLFWINVRD